LELSTPGDSENYRSTRFDHSGMFQTIRFRGLSLCQRWRSGPANPDANDDVTGPCEEFGQTSPLGYDPSRPKSRFVKIGVGVLIRNEEPEYKFWGNYEFAKRGEWRVESNAESMRFEQVVMDEERDKPIGYRYRKEVRVSGDGWTISHRLENLGADVLETDHYNHNFFLIDGKSVGSDYEVTLPYELVPQEIKAEFQRLVKVSGRKLTFLEPVGERSYFARLDGHQNEISQNRFELWHKPSNVRIVCSSDYKLHKVNFWGTSQTICPEPFIFLSLRPKEAAEWTLKYAVSQ
jgi:hypothetical protein